MDSASSRGDAPKDAGQDARDADTRDTIEGRRGRFRLSGRRSGRRRTLSIRTRVTALLLVPLLTLIALWGYAAAVTGRAALAQRNYHTLDRTFAPTGQGVLVELGKERQMSAVFLSTPRSRAPEPPPELVQQRARLDAAIATFRREATSERARRATNAAMEERVAGVLKSLGGLPGLRNAVDERSIERMTAINSYSTMVDDMHRLYDTLIIIDDSELYNWTLSTRHGGRAMELLQRENALIASALVTGGRMTHAEHRLFVEMIGEQRWQWVKQRSLLKPEIYGRTTARIFASPPYQSYREIEDRIADADPSKPLPIGAEEFRSASGRLVQEVNQMLLTNSQLAGEYADDLGRAAYIRVGVVGGLGLLATIISVLLSLRFARGFVRELVRLRGSAEELADHRLPDLVQRLSRNERVDVESESPPLPASGTTEIVQLSESFGKVQRTAIDAAVGQAELRAGVSRIFLNIARRNQSLLHRQLTMLDALESRADSDDLEDLFRIDHLTTRMRRHAESLIILSGATPGRGWRHPVRFSDVLRAALSEIEDYTRVTILTDSEDGLVGAAVTDVVHLLAELLENATTFSPPNTEVRMMAERVGTGFVIEIEDRGLGVKPEMLEEANRRLAEPPEYDLVDADQLGLFVVARLAARHNINVSLQRSPYGGVTAIVLLPHELVVPAEQMAAGMLPAGDEPARDRDGSGDAPAAEPPREREPVPAPAARPEGVVPLRETDEAGRFSPRPSGERGRGHADEEARAGAAGDREAPPAVPELTGSAAPWGAPEPAGAPRTPSGPRPNPWSDDAVPLPDAHRADPPGPFGAPVARPYGPSASSPEEDADVVDAELVEPDEGPRDHRHVPGTHKGLPRRVRQENLAPQLRRDPPPPPPRAGDGASGGIARSPEEARSLMASIQQGWRRGRASDVGDEERR